MAKVKSAGNWFTNRLVDAIHDGLVSVDITAFG